MNRPLLVVGDTLLDHDLDGRADRLAPDAPVPVVDAPRRTTRPGGAALAASLAAADGRRVTLITALGTDPASETVRVLLADQVLLVELPLRGALSTKTRVMAGGRPLLRLDDGDGRAVRSTRAAEEALAGAGAVLVSDYGRGTADALRDALTAAAARIPVVWDPHPRGGPPVEGACLTTPSAAEAHACAEELRRLRHESAARPEPSERTRPAGDGRRGAEPPRQPGPAGHDAIRSAAADARLLVDAWHTASVAVTLGDRGALLSHGEEPLLVEAPRQADGDPCGAGDCFAATAAGLLADGALPEAAVQAAVSVATRYVAEGGARALRPGCSTATPQAAPPSAGALAAQVRAGGGTVVAAGGCFDLLHAGHIALLESARDAGDCLIVCLNSDASVRRRKGDGRPVVPAADRARVLAALACVDAVVVFDEDTPEELLRTLRPHIWAKGTDYGVDELPEARLLDSWGGQVILLPYLDGRSTTALAERAARTGAP